MTVDDRRGDVDEACGCWSRECSRSISKAASSSIAVAFHQDALGALRQGAAAKRALEVLVLGEPAQHDVDRALPVLDVCIVDV